MSQIYFVILMLVVTVVLNLAYFESQMSSFMAATSTDMSV
jgi:hypothetical protein